MIILHQQIFISQRAADQLISWSGDWRISEGLVNLRVGFTRPAVRFSVRASRRAAPWAAAALWRRCRGDRPAPPCSSPCCSDSSAACSKLCTYGVWNTNIRSEDQSATKSTDWLIDWLIDWLFQTFINTRLTRVYRKPEGTFVLSLLQQLNDRNVYFYHQLLTSNSLFIINNQYNWYLGIYYYNKNCWTWQF